MMIFPASHYTMGGIWVDYELQTSIKGLFAIGECNFSDHGANRLGASALMQGLADGYFVLPYTMQNYLSDQIKVPRFSTDAPEFEAAEKGVRERIAKLMAIKGTKSPDQLHKKLGHVMWNLVGMGRTLQGLVKAIDEIEKVRQEFYSDLRIVGSADDLNTELEKALRLEDFLVIAKMMAIDALHRNESCGAHFREEYQTADGEAARNDKDYMYVGCWKYRRQREAHPPEGAAHIRVDQGSDPQLQIVISNHVYSKQKINYGTYNKCKLENLASAWSQRARSVRQISR